MLFFKLKIVAITNFLCRIAYGIMDQNAKLTLQIHFKNIKCTVTVNFSEHKSCVIQCRILAGNIIFLDHKPFILGNQLYTTTFFFFFSCKMLWNSDQWMAVLHLFIMGPVIFNAMLIFFLNICANNFDKIYLNNIIIFINYS